MLERIEVNDLKERLWNLASDDSISVYEVEAFLRNFIKRKPLPLVEMDYESYCRCSLNSKEEIFKTVSRCSYNPVIDNIELQRCNYEKQQVLYAAVPTLAKINCSGTSILEVTWEHISNYYLHYYFMTLSRWKTRKLLKVFFFPDLEKIGAKSNGVDVERDMLESVYVNEHDIPYYLSILKLFREIFSIKDNKKIWYKVSSAFYNCIMRFGKDEHLEIDGMVYSSANTGKAGTNIVLKKELIDSKTVYCDYIQMWIGRRNSSDPKDIWMHPVSEGVTPKADETFDIVLYPEFVERFRNAPQLNIGSIVE